VCSSRLLQADEISIRWASSPSSCNVSVHLGAEALRVGKESLRHRKKQFVESGSFGQLYRNRIGNERFVLLIEWSAANCSIIGFNPSRQFPHWNHDLGVAFACPHAAESGGKSLLLLGSRELGD